MKTIMHRLNLAIPADIWKRIQVSAKKHRRSATQEIIHAIEFFLRMEQVDHE